MPVEVSVLVGVVEADVVALEVRVDVGLVVRVVEVVGVEVGVTENVLVPVEVRLVVAVVVGVLRWHSANVPSMYEPTAVDSSCTLFGHSVDAISRNPPMPHSTDPVTAPREYLATISLTAFWPTMHWDGWRKTPLAPHSRLPAVPEHALIMALSVLACPAHSFTDSAAM